MGAKARRRKPRWRTGAVLTADHNIGVAFRSAFPIVACLAPPPRQARNPPVPIHERHHRASIHRRNDCRLLQGFWRAPGNAGRILGHPDRQLPGLHRVFRTSDDCGGFLSDDLGLDDRSAGYTITVFTSATSLMLLFSGMTTDWLGIRRSLNIALGGQLVLRLAMVWVGLTPSLPHRGLLAGVIFLLMAPFMAGLQTIFQAATNRFTPRRSRSAGFHLGYLFMNIGAAAAGFSIDIVRKLLHLPNVHIFTLGVITAVLCLIVGKLMVKNEEQLVNPDDLPAAQAEEKKVEHKNPWQIWREMIREPALWRLLVLIGLIVGVRAVYVYLYLLMPKYWLRTIGPDAAIGTLNAINPIGIVIGIVLFIPFTNKFGVFRMLVYGAMISAIALFPMALPWTVYGMSIGQAH